MTELNKQIDEVLEDVDLLKRKARQELISKCKTDLGRLAIGFILMCLLFFPVWSEVDPWQELKANLHIVSYVTGFAIATALITHLTRRLLFPYIDLKQFSDKALSDPLSAGMVFFGVCLIISTTIYASAGFFK